VAKLRAKYAPKQRPSTSACAGTNRRSRARGRAGTLSEISPRFRLVARFSGRSSSQGLTTTTISKAATAMPVWVVRRTVAGCDRAGETVEAIKQQLADLDAQFQAEAAALERRRPASESFETIESPEQSEHQRKLVALAWTPHVRDASGQLVPTI